MARLCYETEGDGIIGCVPATGGVMFAVSCMQRIDDGAWFKTPMIWTAVDPAAWRQCGSPDDFVQSIANAPPCDSVDGGGD